MPTNHNDVENCFSAFDAVSPQKQNPTAQILYDYEKHYMELVRKYKPEIQFISGLVENLREEQIEFYSKTLPSVIEHLNQDIAIDEETKRIWLNRFVTNMDNSFNLSESVIEHYVTKHVQEFNEAVNRAIQNSL